MTALNYTSGNPANLTGGTNANMADISGPFADLKTFLNGANLDTTNLATSAKPATLLGAYRDIFAIDSIAGGLVAGSTYTARAGATVVLVGATPGSSALGALHFDPADYTVAGLTTQLRIRAYLATNGTAPAVNFLIGMVPITSVGGPASNIGIATAGAFTSSCAINAPALNSQNFANTGDFAAPAAGGFAMGVVTAGAWAANAVVSISWRLQVRHI